MITRRGIDALRYEIAVLTMLLHEVEPEPMLNKNMIH